MDDSHVDDADISTPQEPPAITIAVQQQTQAAPIHMPPMEAIVLIWNCSVEPAFGVSPDGHTSLPKTALLFLTTVLPQSPPHICLPKASIGVHFHHRITEKKGLSVVRRGISYGIPREGGILNGRFRYSDRQSQMGQNCPIHFIHHPTQLP
jgi:hypothetical protein